METRPLKRTIQKEIEDALAYRILKGEITENTHITVKLNENQLAFYLTKL